MSWNFTGAQAAHVRAATVPVCRIGGQLEDGAKWWASAVPLISAGRRLILTASHALEGIETADLHSLSNCNKFEDRHLRLGTTDWVLDEDCDLAATEVKSDAIEPWAAWDITWALAALPDEGLRGLYPVEVVFPPHRDKVQDGHGVAEMRSHEGRVAYRLEDDLGRSSHEFAVDIEPVYGMSGSPAFAILGDQIAFAGIVTAAIDFPGRSSIAVLSAARVAAFLSASFS